MSFTQIDPWNHMEVLFRPAPDGASVLDTSEAYWQCSNCGADSSRGSGDRRPLTVLATEEGALRVLQASWQEHLRKNHDLRPRCSFTYHGLQCTELQHGDQIDHKLTGAISAEGRVR